MFAYPAIFTPEPEGGFTVTFRDAPEAITYGETEEKAASMAVDALETAFSDIIAHRADIPSASPPAPNERVIELSPHAIAKIGIHIAMREKGMGKAALARALKCHLPQVDRLLDLCHQSRWAMIMRALTVLDKRLSVEIRDAA